MDHINRKMAIDMLVSGTSRYRGLYKQADHLYLADVCRETIHWPTVYSYHAGNEDRYHHFPGRPSERVG